MKTVESLEQYDKTQEALGDKAGVEEHEETVSSKTCGEDDEGIEYPDGGFRAWSVVAGAVFCNIATFGFVNTWGVFQSYYETDKLKDVPPSNIAWIGSMQYALVFGSCLVCGRLLDLGYFRPAFATGTTILIVATFLVAECKEYWQFLLCQGLAIGIGAGATFGPTMGVVGHWFNKRRGLAVGITSTGSSIGGTLYPIAARHLIPKIGFSWTMRVLAFLNLLALVIANLTIKPRLPPKNLPGGVLNIRVFKSIPFSIYSSSTLVAFLGIYTVLTYIDVSAIRAGVSPDFSFYLVSICNASSGFGRLAMGFLADRYGAVNVMTPMSLLAVIMTLAWPHATSQGSLIAVAVLYGLSTSAFISTFGLPIYSMGKMGDIGRRLGTVMLFTAAGSLCGPPISGAINRATGGIHVVSYYAGSAVLLSVIMQLATKRLVLGRFSGKF